MIKKMDQEEKCMDSFLTTNYFMLRIEQNKTNLFFAIKKQKSHKTMP